MTTTINPPGFKNEYLAYLNTCFPGWGDSTKYDWVFERKAGLKLADLILIRDEKGEVIAGSAVSYRKLQYGEQLIDIGIMTGSWTLPTARGKGCFSTMITESKKITADNHAPLLTAFVTETNASSRRLKDAGSNLVPTHHLFSPAGYVDGIAFPTEEEITEKTISAVYEQYHRRKANLVRFDYSLEEFKGQFINRVTRPVLLAIGNAYAILEETHNAMMLLFFADDLSIDLAHTISALSTWAHKTRSKKLLVFSTRPGLTQTCINLGFEAIPGYFTVLGNHPAFDVANFLDKFDLQAGDKM